MKKVLYIIFLLVVLYAITSMTFAQSSIEYTPEPTEIVPVKEEIQTVYRLTIYYIYEDGTEAAPTYSSQVDVGLEYDVLSPIIEGFIASEDEIKGRMPARDIEFTVIYIGGRPGIVPGNIYGGGDESEETKVIRLLTIEDYETSLGLGASMMNLGVCVE